MNVFCQNINVSWEQHSFSNKSSHISCRKCIFCTVNTTKFIIVKKKKICNKDTPLNVFISLVMILMTFCKQYNKYQIVLLVLHFHLFFFLLIICWFLSKVYQMYIENIFFSCWDQELKEIQYNCCKDLK